MKLMRILTPTASGPVRGLLYRVGGDAWVGGYNDATGDAYVRQYASGVWTTRDPAMFTVRDMVWISDSDVYALGTNTGTSAFEAQHWNGTLWSTSHSAASGFEFSEMAAGGTNDVYLVKRVSGTQVTYYHYTGTWDAGTTRTRGASAAPHRVNLAPSGDLRMGWGADVYNLTTGAAEYTATTGGPALQAIWMNDNSNGYAAANRSGTAPRSQILTCVSGTWSVLGTQPSASGAERLFIHGIHGTGMSDVWCTGTVQEAISGNNYYTFLILHWNGTAWTRHSFTQAPVAFNDRWIEDVRALGANDVWAAGYSNFSVAPNNTLIVLHWDGSTWTDRTPLV